MRVRREFNSVIGAKMADTKKKERKRFTTPPFRISFPALWTPRQNEDGEGKPKFGTTAIWKPSDFADNDKKRYQAILAELNARSLAAFGKEWKKLPDNIKRGLRDGAAKEGVEGYGPGIRFANMTSLNRPGVVSWTKGDDDKFEPIGPEHGNEELIYPGAWCRATVSIWSYGGKGDKPSKGKGVGIGLLNLQRLAKVGARLDNRVAAEDDFDDDLDAEWMDDTGEDDADNDIDDGDDDEFG